jgi:osmotically inducible lipoprotein OsmB
MTQRTLSLSALALLALSLGACSDMSRRDQNTATGAAIGGVAGAVLGGGAAGTVGGAVVGGVIGNQVDPKKK